MYASDPSEYKTIGLPFSAYFLGCFVIHIQAGARLATDVSEEADFLRHNLLDLDPLHLRCSFQSGVTLFHLSHILGL
jgi:hypothetical protein